MWVRRLSIELMNNSWSILRSLLSVIGAQASKLGAWKFVEDYLYSYYHHFVCQPMETLCYLLGLFWSWLAYT